MAPVKVESTGKAKPKIIRVSQPPREVALSFEPDLVRVRALNRGFYAPREVVRHPGTGKLSIERADQIRNPGDVFDMDTGDMRVVVDGQLQEIPFEGIGGGGGETRDAHREKPHASDFGTQHIETARGTFELPSWVELAEEAEEVSVPAGHKTRFGKKDGDVL